MSDTTRLVVTKKGERLIARKFGVPYGLFLAYIDTIPAFLVAVISFTLGMIASLTGNYWILLYTALPFLLLVKWAERHFNV